MRARTEGITGREKIIKQSPKISDNSSSSSANTSTTNNKEDFPVYK